MVVNLDGLRVAADTLGVVHALLSTKIPPSMKTKLDVNKALRVYVRQMRRLLWPEKTYKTVNAGVKTKFRSSFHKARETLANR